MGKARWWVCEGCKSLNDLPANKCYNCRVARPASPSLIDDQYGVVGGDTKRVGITVDLSQVADLTNPDPIETQKGGSIIEAFEEQDEQPPDASYPAGRTLDPVPRQPAARQPAAPPPPPPLREPTPRGIAAVGGRDWTKDLAPPPPPPPRESEVED
ncbi:MAG: hypothetical protein U9O18_11265 [Chloroflexota bacterium]|nr:hypothetical protein [Chloroflexota bacterium]